MSPFFFHSPFSEGDLSVSVTAFDDILSGPFKAYADLSAKIGGDVATHATAVSQVIGWPGMAWFDCPSPEKPHTDSRRF